LILFFGIFRGTNENTVKTSSGLVSSLNSNSGTSESGGTNSSGLSQTSWPTTGYASKLPAPTFGQITEVDDRGSGSYVIYVEGATVKDCQSYVQLGQSYGFNLNGGYIQTDGDGGGYHYAEYNSSNVRLEVLYYEDGDVSYAVIFVGMPS
jgi:hypothetical protein